MKWKTAVKTVGDEADAYLNQLVIDRWMIKSVTPLVDGLSSGDDTTSARVVIAIVACQSPEYETKAGGSKGRWGKKKAAE